MQADKSSPLPWSITRLCWALSNAKLHSSPNPFSLFLHPPSFHVFGFVATLIPCVSLPMISFPPLPLPSFVQTSLSLPVSFVSIALLLFWLPPLPYLSVFVAFNTCLPLVPPLCFCRCTALPLFNAMSQKKKEEKKNQV